MPFDGRWIAACAIVLAGCHSADPVVGKWNGTVGVSLMGASVNLDTTAQFNADQTVTLEFKFGPITVDANGKFKHQGNTLAVTLADYNVSGAVAAQTAVIDPQIKDVLNQWEDMKVSFPSSDKMELKIGDQTDDFTRSGTNSGS